jgi:serine/threonine protein kinase
MKGKYCCFNCAKKDYREHEITDICDTPGCNYSYNFPLENVPDIITSDKGLIYTVIEPKGRGFYAATYLCTRGNLNTKTILKVTPQSFYEKVKSNACNDSDSFDTFKWECLEHSRIAEGADQHIVGIEDYFKTDINYAGTVIPCFVAELRYVPGHTFAEYIHEPGNITARNFVQLTIDLLNIWGILNDKLTYHNDLHGNNLIVEELKGIRRIGELNSSIRLIAIDMNSTADENLSGMNREGDQSYIYNHIAEMTRLLREKNFYINGTEDIDYRLIKTLEKLLSTITPGLERNRHPNVEELIQILKEDFNSNLSYAPWERPLSLNNLEDGYNAQTIHKCYIPFLLVDPNNEWINDISISGPQIITGMRGCGKTTLLGALDFHSRAMWGTNSKAEKVSRLHDDKYIGISASCSNLIDNRGKKATDNFAKLIWLYTRELMSIIRHLKSIDANLLVGDYIPKISTLLKSITTVNFSDLPIEPNDSEFERYLSIKMAIFSEGENGQLKIPPKDAFEAVASMIMSLSPVWNNKRVFFLLDDASTRYLRVETISELFTNLLYQSNNCSFKITTELQSVELMRVYSPGDIALAREGRDFTFYDFGAKVLEKFNSKSGGKSFLNDILNKRCELRNQHS